MAYSPALGTFDVIANDEVIGRFGESYLAMAWAEGYNTFAWVDGSIAYVQFVGFNQSESIDWQGYVSEQDEQSDCVYVCDECNTLYLYDENSGLSVRFMCEACVIELADDMAALGFDIGIDYSEGR